MLDRLLGLETEYAIRFSPRQGARPGNDTLFTAIAGAVQGLVATERGERGASLGTPHLFVQNGGALYYEVLPQALRGGLLEASTPECRTPSQLLLYQKAQEALLLRALPLAEQSLRASGWDGELGLIKNCRDAEDHVYGAQENYEAELASGLPLLLYRVGLALCCLTIPFAILLFWAVYAIALFVAIVLYSASILPFVRRHVRLLDALTGDDTEASRSLGLVLMRLESSLYLPLLGPFTLLLRAFAFRRERRELTGFLVSRPIVSGAGTLAWDGLFGLSEKGPAMRRLIRAWVDPDDRPIFDTGNLMKDLTSVLYLNTRRLRRLFRRRQRLQLALSDSNAAQVAEYLKIGTTALVLDMIESGAITGAPEVADPVQAVHAIGADPTLQVAVPLRGGGVMTALQLQRWYLERARSFTGASGVTSIEARELVRLWGEALDALEQNPEVLVGRLDWVTKRLLIERAGAELSPEEQKKIDLRYHELGSGYLAELERRGAAVVLVGAQEIEEAIEVPPEDSPARVRGRLIRELAGSNDRVTVSWDSVRIGGRVTGKVIRLGDHRR